MEMTIAALESMFPGSKVEYLNLTVNLNECDNPQDFIDMANNSDVVDVSFIST